MPQKVKNLSALQEIQVLSLGQEDPWRRKWQPTPVFLPEEFHDQRSLVIYSPRDCKELGTTKQLTQQMQIPQEERGMAQKEPLWMSVSIKLHGFQGGNVFVAGFPSFHALLLCTVPIASQVSKLPTELTSGTIASSPCPFLQPHSVLTFPCHPALLRSSQQKVLILQ